MVSTTECVTNGLWRYSGLVNLSCLFCCFHLSLFSFSFTFLGCDYFASFSIFSLVTLVGLSSSFDSSLNKKHEAGLL